MSTESPAPLSKSKSIKLVTLYNDLVPESLRLSRELPLGIAEQQIIWHTSFKFTGQGDIPARLREQLEGVLSTVNREQRSLRDITSEPRLFGYTETGISHEHALARAWKEYRVLVKQLSGIHEQHSWFSPAYRGSHEIQKGPMQGDVVAKMSDYQRWSMSPTKDLERISNVPSWDGENIMSTSRVS